MNDAGDDNLSVPCLFRSVLPPSEWLLEREVPGFGKRPASKVHIRSENLKIPGILQSLNFYVAHPRLVTIAP
jgi:hypothetical protein